MGPDPNYFSDPFRHLPAQTIRSRSIRRADVLFTTFSGISVFRDRIPAFPEFRIGSRPKRPGGFTSTERTAPFRAGGRLRGVISKSGDGGLSPAYTGLPKNRRVPAWQPPMHGTPVDLIRKCCRAMAGGFSAHTRYRRISMMCRAGPARRAIVQARAMARGIDRYTYSKHTFDLDVWNFWGCADVGTTGNA